ncbi:type II toxin-antitoxin system ParD family antitoxin [Rhizobium sp. CCGE 510]|uniref:type II toxin-antitoxin system ParD family antitoxin n=1 Tax=Rhizobium sp. CCGE 510 TaxID=1132836 RepID=UPI00027B842D|nr:type II toxin-antitoxin system ParD family antitoxin [Rhizobium sp. CCGE 510]EJT03707.1 hypothetical protein RCCGE510_19743 [Rhizobium sp. CCGE 510]
MGEAAKVTVTLEPRLEEYVRDEVARGAYKSSSDYIESVLRERYDDDRRVHELEDELQKGIADLEAGQVMSLDEAFDSVYAELGLDKLRPR